MFLNILRISASNGIYSMAKCHGCILVINQSYWFEILQTIIKSFDGWSQVIIFLLLALTFLVFNPRSLEGGGGVKLTPPPSLFLALNFCFLTDCQKFWHNCSLFVNTSFDTN